MSTTFSTVITGTGVFAVPTDDASLAAASAGFAGLLAVAGIPNLTFDVALAFVRDGDGGASRTLNCLLTNVKYSGAICPSAANTQTLLAGIKAALLASPSISAVSIQEANLVDQSGGVTADPWTRDAGGFIYPTTSTDDLYIGGATPNGVWFDDGDMVLGAAAMSGGGERLRIIGDVRVESILMLPLASSGIVVGTTGISASGELVRTVSDTQFGSNIGVRVDLNDTSTLPGANFTGFNARFQSAVGTSGSYVGFGIEPTGGGVGWAHIGFNMPDMAGTAMQGSLGFNQAGVYEINEFQGRCGLSASVASSTSLKVGVPTIGASASWSSIKTDRSPTLFTGGPSWDHIQMNWTAVNAAGQSAGQVRYLAITSPLSSQNINVSSCYGLYIDDLQSDANFIYASTPYGVYQAGDGDFNWFAGNTGFGSGKTAPGYDVDAAGDINCDGSFYQNGTQGLSGTYNFGGGGSGDVASMTFAGGILTAVTTVP